MSDWRNKSRAQAQEEKLDSILHPSTEAKKFKISVEFSYKTAANYEKAVELAKKNAYALSAGHSFIIFMKDIFPINVMAAIKQVPEVCRIFCATANPVEVIIAESEQGRGILGVIDGFPSKGIETEEDIQKRRNLLRTISYKL